MSGSLSTELAESIRLEGKRFSHPSDNFRMSSMGHCIRKQVAVRAGIAPAFPADDRGVLKMWVGTALHKATQAKLEACGFLDASWTEREVRYRSYVGHVDGLTRRLPATEQYGPAVVEIKWTSDDSVAKYDWPEHYEWQNMGCVLAAGLKRGLLYQVGRENGLDRERILVMNTEWKEKLNQEIDLVEKAWDEYQKTKSLPTCRHRFGWEWKLCGYREEKKKKTDPLEGVNPFLPTKTEQELADFLDQTNNQEKN